MLASCTFNSIGEATKTIVELESGLYSMEIKGDDGFDGFLANGGARSSEEVAAYVNDFLNKGPFGKTKVSINPGAGACTAFQVKDENGNYLVGRNFDWEKCKTMILKNNPDGGYASIATTNLEYLDFGPDYKPDDTFNHKIMAFASVFVPQDGINEKGLVVADLMAGDDEVTSQSAPGLINLTTSTAIRLLLNKAADVDEALKILDAYNMHSDIGKAHHLFIADAKGKSVVVEWQNNVMLVGPTNVLTNHYLLGEKIGKGQDGSIERYLKTLAVMVAHLEVMDTTEVKNLLRDVVDGTQWSIVYNQTKPMETFYFMQKFDNGYSFSL